MKRNRRGACAWIRPPVPTEKDAIDGPPAATYGPPPLRCRALSSAPSPESSMLLTDLVAPNAIIPALKVNSKKQILQELAAKAAELSGQSERTVLETLQQREKLGSTGVGGGVAIPHGKLPKLGKLFGLFARLERPVDFEALDGPPVDLVVLLLSPQTAGGAPAHAPRRGAGA